MPVQADNVYILLNSASGTTLDLNNGLTVNGTPCQGWEDASDKGSTYDQQWFISAVATQNDIFTLINLRSGTYLDLNNGSSTNGTQVQGWSKAGSGAKGNQQWRITPEGTNYRLQNVASNTSLDLNNGNSANGTKVQGWRNADVPAQKWTLRRVSRTGQEINNILRLNSFTGAGFNSYLQDGLYIVPPASVRNEVFSRTGLSSTGWRPEIFDCDDFAFVAKAAVAKWGNDAILANGVAILFGVMFGRDANGDAHAYNWYLAPNLNAILFFDPQNGMEMVDPGHMAYFGVF